VQRVANCSRGDLRSANLGRDLLKEKRDILRGEFIRLSGSILDAMGSLDERCADGRRELSSAVAFDGPEMVGSAVLAGIAEIEVRLRSRRVAGVPIVDVDKPPLKRSPTERGYSLLATSTRVDPRRSSRSWTCCSMSWRRSFGGCSDLGSSWCRLQSRAASAACFSTLWTRRYRFKSSWPNGAYGSCRFRRSIATCR